MQQSNNSKNAKYLKNMTSNIKNGLMDIISNLDKVEQKDEENKFHRYPTVNISMEDDPLNIKLRS